ncbi:MAG: hypothetical protein ACREQ9_20740, partial [Candidatus Binatia bacterium]
RKVRVLSRSDRTRKLAAERGEREQVATELLLHAVRSAAEPRNYGMLSRLNRDGSSTVEELMTVSGLGRLPVLERVGHLMQAGLVSRALDSDRVQPTRLATGLVGFLERVKDRLCVKIEERLPGVLEDGK